MKLHYARLARYESIAEVTWAMLAAYIDGEGCIQISPSGKQYGRPNRYLGLRVIVGQKSPLLTDWLHNNFGGTVTFQKKSKGRSEMFYWTITGAQAATILIKCLNYFIVKKEQAEVAIAYRNTITYGRTTISEEVAQHRTQLRQKLYELKHGSASAESQVN